ncbi:MAG: deoxyribodipyrimidine photo-lyase [Thermoflexales bacterium]
MPSRKSPTAAAGTPGRNVIAAAANAVSTYPLARARWPWAWAYNRPAIAEPVSRPRAMAATMMAISPSDAPALAAKVDNDGPTPPPTKPSAIKPATYRLVWAARGEAQMDGLSESDTTRGYTRESMAPVIHWFRRDLRLIDNTALAAAAASSAGDVLPVFIIDPALTGGRDVSAARLNFMFGCLRDLDAHLRQRGSRLMIRRGDPATVLPDLARETGTTTVAFNRDYTPLARRRDARVTAALRDGGIGVDVHRDAYIREPGELLSGAGAPYTVFTPFKRAWLALPKDWSPARAAPALRGAPDFASEPLPNPGPDSPALPPPGERPAFARLRQFAGSGGIDAYADQRDALAADGTSRLSAHLRFGALSPRQAAQAALDSGDSKGAQTFLSELIWREFYAHVLFHFPHADGANFKRAYDKMTWGSGDATEDTRRFEAWTQGRTGYPIVDAAMRQLAETGWMPNRARMITASFLTKDLHLDWRRGESFFMRSLIDGDPASNNGGWQWAAGTGTDAQPWFRVFNPTLQGQRFDPDGAYVRQWVPELAGFRGADVHMPWGTTASAQRAAKCVIGETYPAPIVDHATQRAEILRRFSALKAASLTG